MNQKQRKLAVLLATCMLLSIICGCVGQDPSRVDQPEIWDIESADTPTPVLPMSSPTLLPTLEPTPQPATPTPGPTISPSPKPTDKPTPTPEATASATPTLKPTPDQTHKVDGSVLAGVVIGIDPGHQAHSNRELEPVAPGSSEMKKKVSSGTSSPFNGTREHEVNLAVGLLLRDLLEEAGATVVMTRTKADVDISNVERAKLFNRKEVALGVRLHCNGSTDASQHGAFMLVPKEHPYYDENVKAAKLILKYYGESTGLSVKKGITYRDDQTGFNWCERPVANIEMGHMTNEEDDRKLTDADFQVEMARGIYNGIVAYFQGE